MRKYLRQIAKARMKIMKIGNVNKKMSLERRGVKIWRLVLNEDPRKLYPNPRKPRRKVRRLA